MVYFGTLSPEQGQPQALETTTKQMALVDVLANFQLVTGTIPFLLKCVYYFEDLLLLVD